MINAFYEVVFLEGESSLEEFFNRKTLAIPVWSCLFVSGIFNVSSGFYESQNISLVTSVHVFPGKSPLTSICSSKTSRTHNPTEPGSESSPGISAGTSCCFPQHSGCVWLGIQIHYSYQPQLASSFIPVKSLFCALQASHIPRVYLGLEIN